MATPRRFSPSGPPPPAEPSPRRPAALYWAVVLGGLGALVAAAAEVRWRPLTELDARVAHALHDMALAHPGWTGTARFFTDWPWDPVTMRMLAAVAAVVLWRRGERRLALLLAATVGAGALVQRGLKAALGRSRPRWEQPVDGAEYGAMPSGHAMTAALVCGLLVWLVCSRVRRAAVCRPLVGAAAVSVVGVSFTRVFLGVHWLSDVVAGVLLGLALAALAAGAARRLRPASGRIAV